VCIEQRLPTSPTDDPAHLINLGAGLRGPFKRTLYSLVRSPLESFLAVDSFNALYKDCHEQPSEDNFFVRALRTLKVGFEVTEADIARIPREGPLLVVANHPYGGLDGLVMAALVSSVRADLRLISNYLMLRVPEFRKWMFAVDPFNREDSMRQNIAGMKQAIKHLRAGGCINTFPSGTVSHIHLRTRQVTDPAWNPNLARLVLAAEATVLPVYFEGNNSALFQIMGLVHPLVRTALLPREMMRKRFQNIRLRIGNPIPFRRLADFPNDEAMTEFLRLNTYLLRSRAGSAPRRRFPVSLNRPSESQPPRVLAPLAPPVPTADLARDFAGIPPEQMLVDAGVYAVCHARAEQIPHILPEIGRLREQTFREVNEGTGSPRDLDQFDAYYRHLFLWDREKQAIVGAYRFVLSDEILPRLGSAGFYSSTLFKYKPGFFEALNPSMELGRSFIVSDYQRKQASLALIWRGLGRFLVQHPQYRVLFGPVSINPDYQTMSKDLIIQFLRKHRFDNELSTLVKAKRPPLRQKLRGSEKRAMLASVRDIDDVSALISEIETDKKGVPVLLRHYLKMNGRIVSFNVDEDFGQCIDGLIIVDLTQSDPKLLRAYMTPEGAESFLAYHQAEPADGPEDETPAT
jgi:putative hemolysin